LIQQTLYSCLYLTDHTLYADSPELKAFFDGIVYMVNTFYLHSMTTTVLRDEDINFLTTTDMFDPKSHPTLKDLTLQGILTALSEHSNSEFAPYLTWMQSIVMTTAWTLEPKSIDYMRVAPGGGKNKKKKKAAAPVAVEEATHNMMVKAIVNIKQSIADKIEAREWAASTCDEKIIYAIPATVNKKHFKKLTHEQAVEKLEQIQNHLKMLLDLKTNVRAKTIIHGDIIAKFDLLLSEKPCSFIRIAFEKAIFVQNEHNEFLLLNEEPFEAFIRRQVIDIHPFIKPFVD